jgi:hypothetical protein
MWVRRVQLGCNPGRTSNNQWSVLNEGLLLTERNRLNPPNGGVHYGQCHPRVAR